MSRNGWILCLFVWLFSIAWQPGNGRLLITEVYYDTPGDDSQEEWIEIANLGTAVTDLSDIKFGDEEQYGGREGMVRFPAGAVLEPGEVIIVAQAAAGFQRLFSFQPDYEILDSDPAVPDMRRYLTWALGDLGLNNNGDELLLLDADNQILDSLNYGDSEYYFAPAINGVFRGSSIARIPADCDTNSAADWQPLDVPSPGQISFEGECSETAVAPEAEDFPPIGTIQGNDAVSGMVNERVTFRGVVTGFYEDINTNSITFYTMFVQDLPGLEDGDPRTSDGIAVFLGRERPSYKTGDQVQITGQVTEFFGFTEVDDNDLVVTVEANGRPLPEPISIDPPADNEAQAVYFERLEGMRVRVDGEARVVGPTFSGCGLAVVHSEVVDLPVVRQRLADPMGQIIPVLHTSDVDCSGFPSLKTGDRVAGLVGPLIYHFDQFKLVNQIPADLQVTAIADPPIPRPPTLTENQFSVATLNVENHFDHIDHTGDAAEPKPSLAEIRLKQSKLANQIGDVLGCPTLVGIQEVENEALLVDLATAVAETCGFTYAVTHYESVDVRGIDVALLSDPRHVILQNAVLQQACTSIDTGIFDETIDCPDSKRPLFSRPPLQVNLSINEQPYTLFVNHFKSKRGGEGETAPRRLAQARYINDLVASLLGSDPQTPIIVMGDFNDYELSEPMLEMTENGRLYNTLSRIPRPERYSFNFGGAAQLLDGILISPALIEQVAFVTIQHVNADFPDADGENLATIYKATDHDLPLLILNSPDKPSTLEPATAVKAPSEQATASPPHPVPTESSGDWPWLIILGGLGIGTSTAVYLFRRQSM